MILLLARLVNRENKCSCFHVIIRREKSPPEPSKNPGLTGVTLRRIGARIFGIPQILLLFNTSNSHIASECTSNKYLTKYINDYTAVSRRIQMKQFILICLSVLLVSFAAAENVEAAVLFDGFNVQELGTEETQHISGGEMYIGYTHLMDGKKW